jgi:hypothetical protein
MIYNTAFVYVFLFTYLTGFSQEIAFEKVKLNFGFVHEGDKVNLNYRLSNTGEKPLIISDYKVECGCTVVDKPNHAILPGESYNLKVTFDTHEKYDRQDHLIVIISNAINSPSKLRFKGVVLKSKKK